MTVVAGRSRSEWRDWLPWRCRPERLKRSSRTRLAILIFSASATAARPAAAQETIEARWGFVGDIGVTEADTVFGVGLAAGASWGWRRFHAAGTADFVVGTASSDSRYYYDTFSNGQRRCRDTTTGQFSNNASCDGQTEVVVSGIVELGIRVSNSFPLELGGGYRVGSGSGGLGVIGFSRPLKQRSGRWYMHGVAGSHYASFRVGLRFVGQGVGTKNRI